jgi:hypothetical protein
MVNLWRITRVNLSTYLHLSTYESHVWFCQLMKNHTCDFVNLWRITRVNLSTYLHLSTYESHVWTRDYEALDTGLASSAPRSLKSSKKRPAPSCGPHDHTCDRTWWQWSRLSLQMSKLTNARPCPEASEERCEMGRRNERTGVGHRVRCGRGAWWCDRGKRSVGLFLRVPASYFRTDLWCNWQGSVYLFTWPIPRSLGPP